MFPDVSGLLTDKLGVKFDEVKTNRNSGFGTRARPFNDEEMSYLDAYINRGYELFRKRVADGRKQSVDAIEQIAKKYGLKVIYDAAHAFGVEVNGESVLTRGDMAQKYVSRYELKDGIQDLEKAAVYLNWLIESLKGV